MLDLLYPKHSFALFVLVVLVFVAEVTNSAAEEKLSL